MAKYGQGSSQLTATGVRSLVRPLLVALISRGPQLPKNPDRGLSQLRWEPSECWLVQVLAAETSDPPTQAEAEWSRAA